MPNLTKQTFGQFLAKPLRDDLLRTSLGKLQKLKEGGSETALRDVTPPVAKSEIVKFDKFLSHGQMRQTMEIERQKTVITSKTTKKPYEPDIPFN